MAPDPQPDERKNVPVTPEDASLHETRATDETGGDKVESSAATAHQWIGKRLGKYEVIDVIGAGGMGFVLKALFQDASRRPDPQRWTIPNRLERY